MRPLLLSAFLAVSVWGGAAEAVSRMWTVSPQGSELAIVYTVDGEPRRGVFSSFAGDARFDPDDLTGAELTFVISTGSLDAGDVFGTEVVKSDDWLAAERFPEARYVLASLTPRAEGGYVAEGALTMRGRTSTVVGEIDISFGDDEARAVGVVVFDRKDFGVGVGFTTLFVEVGAQIAVEFDLTAVPKE